MSTSKKKKVEKNCIDNLPKHYYHGKLYAKGIYIGMRTGLWEEYYHTNGQLALKGNYIKGVEDGWFEYYDIRGSLMKKILYVNI